MKLNIDKVQANLVFFEIKGINSDFASIYSSIRVVLKIEFNEWTKFLLQIMQENELNEICG